ncbi:hypothetical protein OC845_004241 [Tilletia horrida]|nr:hypothetical protein OC845_004241 [Tilletia horrida]
MASYRRISGSDPISNDVLASRKRRGQKVGCCQICKWVSIAFGCLLGFLFCKGLADFHGEVNHPFKDSYLPSNASDTTPAVKPLFTDQTVFDIEATLWLNLTGYFQHHPDLGDQWRHLKLETYQRGDRNITEAAVFNAIVFQGLKIHSKEHTSVKVRLPAAPFFQDPALGPHLRSTFTLVPRSNVDVPADSKFNAAYSALSPSFPIDIPQPGMAIGFEPDVNENRTKIADLSSLYGVSSAQGQNFFYKRRRSLTWPKVTPVKNESIPVVFLNHTNSKMHPENIGLTYSLVSGDNSISLKNGTTYISRNARYVSTRNRISVFQNTPTFEREKYLTEHLKIADGMHRNETFPECDPTAVGGFNLPGIDRLSFSNYAEFESLSKTDDEDQVPISRYAPAMITTESSKYVKYRLELPDFGTEEALAMQTADAIEYDWELYYSPSPIFFKTGYGIGLRNYDVFQDRFPMTKPGGYMDVQDSKEGEPDLSTQLAFQGDRAHPDSKPWRHFIATILRPISRMVGLFFTLYYWASRTTTTGISIPAALGQTASTLLFLGRIVPKYYWDIGQWFTSWTWLALISYFRLAVAFRLEVDGWRVRRVSPSHRERASSRLDTKQIALYGILLVVVVGIYTTGFMQRLQVRAALGDIPKRAPDSVIISRINTAIGHTAGICQLWFNHQSRTFAGQSRVTVLLHLIDALVLNLLLEHVYMISGFLETRSEITLAGLVWPAMLLVQGYQAVVFPSVDQNAKDEDDE